MATSNDTSAMDVSEFRSVYESEGQYNLTVQIPYLAKLAEHYEKLGSEDPTTNWRSILQAHSLYNSCAARHGDAAGQFLQKAANIQNMYNKAAEKPLVPYNKLLDLQTNHRHTLNKIREESKEKVYALLTLIESYQEEPENLDSEHNHMIEQKICTEMRSISICCNKNMIEVAESIVSDSMQLIGVKPPCSFAAVAMGSLAREEATPYSDLEFFFVIEDKNPITESYFEHLAMTVYFLIGNLQETNLKYMDIEELEGWFIDEGKSGFKIDGLRTNAGNIPTGNGKTDEKNKYICTVDSLVDRYEHILNHREETESSGSLTGDDSDMMACLRLISSYGEQGEALLTKLQAKLVEISPNEKRVRDTLHTIFKDMKTYDIDPVSILSKGSCAEMKADVYRYPSLLLLNMKILLRLQTASTWEIIEILKQDKLLSDFPHYFSICLLIRLAMYLSLDSQCERISLSKINSNVVKEHSPKQYHIPQKVILAYFVSMCPTKEALISVFSDTNSDSCLYKSTGQYGRLLSAITARVPACDQAALQMYAKKIPESLYSKVPEGVLFVLAVSFFWSGNNKIAYNLFTARQTWSEFRFEILSTAFEWLLTLYLKKRRENKILEVRLRELLRQNPLHPTTATNLINSFCHAKKSGFCIPFDLAVLDIEFPDDSFSNYLGRASLCLLKEEYEESLKYQLEYLNHLDKVMGKESASIMKSSALIATAELHYTIGEHRDSLGQTRKAQEQYEASLIRYKEILEMDSVLDRPHSRCSAQVYNRIGRCYVKIKNLTLAEEAIRKSVKMHRDLEGDKSMNVMNGYMDLYDINMKIGKIQLAKLYLQKHEELKLYLTTADQKNK